MTIRPSPPLKRPKRLKLAVVAALRGFSKRPTQTHYGRLRNSGIPALGKGFGRFERFEGGDRPR